MALRLAEIGAEEYEFVCTPTGNELPEMQQHWTHLEELLGQPLIRVNAGVSLLGLIAKQRALPNWRMRWCTRLLKIEPFQAYVLNAAPATTYVGLRYDEPGREGVTDWGEGVESRFPLVEWGWGINEVLAYLDNRGVAVPERTDCAICFFQTLGEWYELWRAHPNLYAHGEIVEEWTGHTLRSEQRDTHPAALAALRREFQAGYVPKPSKMKDRKIMCSTCAR